MNAFGLLKPTMVNQVPESHYVVVHPLDDALEEKVDISSLGPMPMTASVKLSLMTLRGYLVLMMLLVLYHVMDLAGALAKHSR
jgi:hypothetical protein